MRKTERLFKKGISFLLVIIMTFTLIPITAFAGSEDTINVYVTLSLEGDFQLSKDGMTGMVRVPLEVPNGATAFDALVKAHKEHHENGEDGYSASDTKYFSKLWGKESTCIGYFTNGKMVMNTNALLSDGDDVEGTVYKSWTTDIYARFDKQEVTVAAGEALSLTLLSNVITTADWSGGMMNGDSATEPLGGATLLIDDGTACNIPWDDSRNLVTDENGKVAVSFESAGTYYISAKKDGKSLIPPICKVIVNAQATNEEKTQIVNEDKEALSFENFKGENGSIDDIKNSFNLPLIGASEKTIISWESNDESVINNNGTVIRPVGDDKAVKLTAKIAYGDIFETKNFDVIVKAYTSDEAETILNEMVENLPSNITPKEWDGVNQKDINVISLIRQEVVKINPSVKVSDICLPGNQIQIATNGDITYGQAEVSDKEVTFTLSLGSILKEYKSSVTVKAKETTKAEALSGDWLTFDTIKNLNTTNSAIISDLSLPEEDNKSYYTNIEWTSSNTDIISIGSYAVSGKYIAKVTRPQLGQENAVVTLNAKIKPGMYWDYGMGPNGPMPNPDYGEKTFNLVVPAVNQEEQDAAQNLINEGIKLFNLDNLIIRGTEEKADIQALIYAFNGVPLNWNYVDELEGFKDEYRVIDIKWTTENPGIGEVSTGAKVTRSAIEQTGDIVLTLSYNGAKAEKRFPTSVKAFTETDVTNEKNILTSVADALTFDIIKDKNTSINEITDNFVKYAAAIKNESGISFEKYKNYHNIGANIVWTSSDTDIISNYLKVTRPKESTKVTLTAILTSSRFSECPGVTPVEKTFIVTVLGVGEEPSILTQIKETEDKIASNYAAKDSDWWGDAATWWNAVGMNAYRNANGNTIDVSEEAKQAFINKSISDVTTLGKQDSTNANILANTINGMSSFGYDATSLYTVNKTKIDAVNKLKSIKLENAKKGWYSTVAPYVLLSLKQGDYNCQLQETEHINYLLEELKNINWSWGADTPAMILQGLAPYYNKDNVKSEVDKLLITLSEKQSEKGSYGSANSDALLIIALAQLGINPNTDTRFIKNDNSLIDALLDYRMPTNDGFWYSDSDLYNEVATQQAFLALIAATKVMESGQTYNIFDFSGMPKKVVYATGTGTGDTSPAEPTSEKDIDVTFTLKTDSGTWIPRTTVSVKSDAKAYHAFTKVLQEKGYSYVGAKNDYVSSVTNPKGITLAEFDKGPNSGWLYKVNGKVPDEGLTKYNLTDGDNIVWYYTTDWTKDSGAVAAAGGRQAIQAAEAEIDEAQNAAVASVEVEVKTDAEGKLNANINSKDVNSAIENAVSEAKKKGDETLAKVELVVKGNSKAKAVAVTLPKATVTELNKKVDFVSVNTPLGDIVFDKKSLETLAKNATGDLVFKIEKREKSDIGKLSDSAKSAIGNRAIFELNVSTEKKNISQFGGTIQVNVPYAIGENENNNFLVMGYIKDDGTLELLKESTYDAKNKVMKFKTVHLSEYAVVYAENKFTDIEKHWAKEYIDYLSARDVVGGMSDSTFGPNNKITRAQFIQILANMSGQELTGFTNEELSKFSDVNSNAWYSAAAVWGAKMGVVTGSEKKDGSLCFNPNESISRQDMLVMISRYMSKVEGSTLTSVKKEVKFSDDGNISNYAKQSVTQLQKAGIINGKTATTFAPKDNASRGECSKMITVLMQNCL